MKTLIRAFVGAMLISAGLVASAQAEVLNIPYSAGLAVSHAGDNCAVQGGRGFEAATPDPSFCVVEFPLAIAVGHTIEQIAIVHHTDDALANPVIQAYLVDQSFTAPSTEDGRFDWISSDVVDGNDLVVTPLMAQSGKAFPDAFIVQPNRSYQVRVYMTNGAMVKGVEVTYQ